MTARTERPRAPGDGAAAGAGAAGVEAWGCLGLGPRAANGRPFGGILGGRSPMQSRLRGRRPCSDPKGPPRPPRPAGQFQTPNTVRQSRALAYRPTDGRMCALRIYFLRLGVTGSHRAPVACCRGGPRGLPHRRPSVPTGRPSTVGDSTAVSGWPPFVACAAFGHVRATVKGGPALQLAFRAVPLQRLTQRCPRAQRARARSACGYRGPPLFSEGYLPPHVRHAALCIGECGIAVGSGG